MGHRRGSTELVSVVVPTWKRPNLLVRAVRSVLAQTYVNWELVIVDDNPPNSAERTATERTVAQIAGDPRIRYLEHDMNRGGAAARNTGIRASRGELVAFLDDDDEWHPTKLEKQVGVMAEAPAGVAMVYAWCRTHLEEAGRTVVKKPSPQDDLQGLLLRSNVIGTTSLVLCRRGPLLEVGMFDESLQARQDVDLYLRLARRYAFALVPEVLVTRHRHVGENIGTDLEKLAEAHRRFYRKHYSYLRHHPEAHARRLFEHGKVLFELGSVAVARRKFLLAARVAPPGWPALSRVLLSNYLGLQLVRNARRARSGIAGGTRTWRAGKPIYPVLARLFTRA